MLELNKIYCGDCLKVMKEIDNNSIDSIITSPPYEDITGAGYNGATKDILFLKLYSEFLDGVFNEYERILKQNGQVFFNIKSKTHNKILRTPHWIEHLESFRKLDFKSYIIWKYAGSFDSTNKRFHLDYEIIYHLSKGEDIYLNTDCGIDDPLTSVWYIPHNIKERLHPTQMPEKVVERILRIASKPNDLILDNFGGSGTTAKVCENLNRNYISIEISPNHCDIAEKRLQQETIFNQ